MLTQNHAVTAEEFLVASDREFDGGDYLQASEKLWGAATHAVMAVAQRREWPHRSHRSLKYAVGMLTAETGDDGIAGGFVAAEKFHKNFYHDEMEDFEIEHDRPLVHRFVARTLTLLNN
jgi:uncharacterized protein (UPF0332 family)